MKGKKLTKENEKHHKDPEMMAPQSIQFYCVKVTSYSESVLGEF